MANKIVNPFFLIVLFASVILFLAVPANSQILIDHNCTKLADIPSEWITAAKQSLHIAYGCSSHGSQLTTGMTGLVTWKGDLYAYNFGGTNGALDLREWDYDDGFGHPDVTTYANDLGDPDRQAWADATREYLNAHPEINVIIWAWCWQMITEYPADIDLYLNLMNEFEEDFPGVKFVYMTGHVTARQLWGEGTHWSHMHYMRAKQIRDFCAANNKILYDFADIESWDPDGNWYGDKLVDEACNYDSDGDGETDSNWAVNWQNAHPGEWYMCESPHTEPLNANLKAYSAWWLWARLAGWSGEADITLSSVSLSPASVLGGNPSTGTVMLDNPAPTGGAVVTLSSSDPAAQTPTSVTVAEDQTTATFVVTTSTVSTDTPVTISGTYNSTTQTATLMVTAPVVVSAITLTSPNGGESWAAGSTHNITWTQTGMAGSVTIDLYKGGVYQKTLGTADVASGTFSWTILTTEVSGTDYMVLVWQGGVSDESDADFSLVRVDRIDFNKDGQEDIIWRYYGSGEIQGWDLAWLIRRTATQSLRILGNDQANLEGLNQQVASGQSKSYLTPTDVGDLVRSVPGLSFRTPLGIGNPQLLKPKKVMKNAIGMDRSPRLTNIKKTRGRVYDSSAPKYVEAPNMPISDPFESASVDPGAQTPRSVKIAALDSSEMAVLPHVLDTAWEIVGTGDFNADGNTDILWRYLGLDYQEGWNVIWYMDGTSIMSYGFLPTVRDTNWKIAGTGDFDGDGKLDVLWRYHGGDYQQGWNVIWHLDGETIVRYGFPTAVSDLDWSIDSIGDFNGDGKSDMLWRYYGGDYYQGLNVIWYMDGETLVSYGYPTAIDKLGWRAEGVGDFDGDNKADILWRYYESGYHQGLNVVWYMDGAAVLSQEFLTAVIDINWRIVNR